jgi:hypothetical protein
MKLATSRDVPVADMDQDDKDPDLDGTNDEKALIIQEGPDMPDRLPDNSADGGFMIFYLDQPTDISSLRFLDTEKRPRVTVTRADKSRWHSPDSPKRETAPFRTLTSGCVAF